MSNQFAYHTIAVGFTILLDRESNIADTMTHGKGLDTLIEGFLGHFEKFFNLRTNLTNFKGIGVISVKAVFQDATINGHDITFFKGLIGG